MSVFESNRAVPLGAVTTHRIVGSLVRAADAFKMWRVSRETRAALARLSDDELADIGLHRGAIPEIARDLARR